MPRPSAQTRIPIIDLVRTASILMVLAAHCGFEKPANLWVRSLKPRRQGTTTLAGVET